MPYLIPNCILWSSNDTATSVRDAADYLHLDIVSSKNLPSHIIWNLDEAVSGTQTACLQHWCFQRHCRPWPTPAYERVRVDPDTQAVGEVPRAVIAFDFVQETAKPVLVALVTEPARALAIMTETQNLFRQEHVRLKSPHHAQHGAAIAKRGLVVGVIQCQGVSRATAHDRERLARAGAHEEVRLERRGEATVVPGRMDLAMSTDFRLTRMRLATKLREKLWLLLWPANLEATVSCAMYVIYRCGQREHCHFPL
jgi:hypothetical protein